MPQVTYRILLLGDFHFGESYAKAGAQILNDAGYEHSLKHLHPFVAAADYFVANLETPIVDPAVHPSPHGASKTYKHWADVAHTPKELKRLGVDAVSLANNHTLDHGVEGLLSSFQQLLEVGIPWFGAGESAAQALEPHVIKLPDAVGGGQIYLHGSFQYSKAYDEAFKFYAKTDIAGCATLSRATLKNHNVRELANNAFHVAFPHWGANYSWTSSAQRKLSSLMHEAGYDFILGHGSHCLQEIELQGDRWVTYSIGNGNFQSGGRFDKFVKQNGILPLGAWAMLHIELDTDGNRRIHIRLYPVYSDNNKTNFQPGPVSETDFRNTVETVRNATADPGLFNNLAQDFGHDELGWYIKLDLGEWPIGHRPTNLKNTKGDTVEPPNYDSAEQLDPVLVQNTYDDANSLSILQQQADLGRNVAPLLISQVAEKEGASTEWLADRVALVNYRDRRVLLQGHRGSESALGKAIIGDKYLTKRFLTEAGVSTPRGDLAASAQKAIEIQKRYGTSVVVKPRFGLKGRGVSVNLSRPDEIAEAYSRADNFRGGVIVEEFIEGDDEYRCLSTINECVSVVRRILPNVTGDGNSTILELIQEKNLQRQSNPSTFGRPTPTDEVTESYLERNGLSYEHVLESGTRATVRDVGGLSSGGEPHECSEVVDKPVKQMAVRGAAAIPGLSWCGVDIMISRKTGSPYVLEINSDADIAGASFPLYGNPAPVAERLWEMRLAATDVDGEDGAALPVILHQAPQMLEELFPEAWENPGSDRRRLADLLAPILRSTGFDVEHVSEKVAHVAAPGKPGLWLANCEGQNDTALVSEIVKRHRIVRRLFRLANVSRTRQGNIKDWAGFRKFLARGTEDDLVLTPYGGAWESTVTHHGQSATDIDESIFEYSARWVAQTRPAGARMSVLATPRGAVAVLSEQTAPNSDAVEAAAAVAVRAVRAVPGLRWAYVSVIVTERNVALAEGLSRNPDLSRTMYLLAGEVNNLIEPIVV